MDKENLISKEEAKQILDNGIASHQRGLAISTLQAKIVNRFLSYLSDRKTHGETEKKVLEQIQSERKQELERITKQMERAVKALDVLVGEYEEMIGEKAPTLVDDVEIAKQFLKQWRKELYGLDVSERIHVAIDESSNEAAEVRIQKELATEAIAVLLGEYHDELD